MADLETTRAAVMAVAGIVAEEVGKKSTAAISRRYCH
jgi:hypothetical protein